MREIDLVALVFENLWWQVLGGGEGWGVECLHHLITFSGFPNSLPRPDGQLPLDQAWGAPSGKIRSHPSLCECIVNPTREESWVPTPQTRIQE